MKSLKILGLQSTELAITGDRITSLHIDNNEMDNYPELFTDWGRVSLPNGIAATSNLPVLQDLTLRNIVMGSTLDCSRFNKLVNIDLSGSTTNQVIFPETGTL
jgi:hypothetical protein